MIKVFYINCEGSQIFEKSISERKLDKLIIDLLDIKLRTGYLTHWRKHKPIPFVELFGVKLFGKRFFSIQIHSIFIPTERYDINSRYQKWDTVNGWNNMSDDNIKSLTELVLARANLHKNKNRSKR